MRPGLIGSLLALLFTRQLLAQDGDGFFSVLKDKALVLDIVARVIEREDTEIWNSVSSKVTIPGRSISIKLVGINVVVLAQFTPYKREDGRHVLVAQGQVWASVQDNGVQYQTTIQTLPVDLGERIYFFPLGAITSDGTPRIEIQLELKPYLSDEETVPEANHAVDNSMPQPSADKPTNQKAD